MRILQTKRFEKAVKKIHRNQKTALDKAIKKIMDNPYIGEEKSGDLAGVRVYKFHMVNQLILLAYTYTSEVITLLMFGPHENFYKDLKD